MKNFILILSALLFGCSAFPAEKTYEGSYEDFNAILDFENEDAVEGLTADELAHIAKIVTEAWRDDPNLKFPARMETCIDNVYHIVADNDTVNNLCDTGDAKDACSYTRRNLRFGERVNSPYNKISIYKEEMFDSFRYSIFVVIHEYIHHMVECLNDRVRDRGDADHSNDYLWWNAENDYVFEDNTWREAWPILHYARLENRK